MKKNKFKAIKLKDLLTLKNKNVLIIGGAGYLGTPMTETFAELGAKIILASRNETKCLKIINQIKKDTRNKNIEFINVDITNEKSLIGLEKKVDKKFKKGLDVLVNCGWSGNKNTFESISYKDWNFDIDVCLTSVFKTIKLFFPKLKKKSGNILNIGSSYGHVAPDYRIYDGKKYANPPSYGAAKAGIIQLTKYCSSFFSPYKIRVNCISPGAFPLKHTQDENPKFIKRLAEKCPLNRIGYPNDLKGVTALLTTEAGSFITGQNIIVDGGWSTW
jgi:NAD(P)-dependent dehydrogenase (short-subunit alcohol dehydrogenase family)